MDEVVSIKKEWRNGGSFFVRNVLWVMVLIKYIILPLN